MGNSMRVRAQDVAAATDAAARVPVCVCVRLQSCEHLNIICYGCGSGGRLAFVRAMHRRDRARTHTHKHIRL